MRNVSTARAGISPYDIFIVVLTVLSIVNLVLYLLLRDETVKYVVTTIDLFISIFFFIDFLKLLFAAKSKKRYLLFEYGWADFLISLFFWWITLFVVLFLKDKSIPTATPPVIE